MVLCSDEKFQIDGDPVVINNTLSVYKEDGFECNHPVTLDSESNVLYA